MCMCFAFLFLINLYDLIKWNSHELSNESGENSRSSFLVENWLRTCSDVLQLRLIKLCLPPLNSNWEIYLAISWCAQNSGAIVTLDFSLRVWEHSCDIIAVVTFNVQVLRFIIRWFWIILFIEEFSVQLCNFFWRGW